MRFAAAAAPFYESVEVVELHHPDKADAPSGTARRTAELIAAARREAGPAAGARRDHHRARRRARRRPSTASTCTGCGSAAWSPTRRSCWAGSGETLTIRHDSLDRVSFTPGVLHRAARDRRPARAHRRPGARCSASTDSASARFVHVADSAQRAMLLGAGRTALGTRLARLGACGKKRSTRCTNDQLRWGAPPRCSGRRGPRPRLRRLRSGPAATTRDRLARQVVAGAVTALRQHSAELRLTTGQSFRATDTVRRPPGATPRPDDTAPTAACPVLGGDLVVHQAADGAWAGREPDPRPRRCG